ncbi:hypothetical protein T492DRAFT_897972 [Pavlovales sp. CCMP2436]|nr:hypothetical protein T492DRAFT_897972 [Pavlovales sp. CCMP2436]
MGEGDAARAMWRRQASAIRVVNGSGRRTAASDAVLGENDPSIRELQAARQLAGPLLLRAGQRAIVEHMLAGQVAFLIVPLQQLRDQIEALLDGRARRSASGTTLLPPQHVVGGAITRRLINGHISVVVPYPEKLLYSADLQAALLRLFAYIVDECHCVWT